MTAQPIDQPAPPRVAKTVASIRAHLPEPLLERFLDELGTAVDAGDLVAVDLVKRRWWAQALVETDPTLKADLLKPLDEVAWLPSPFARRG